MLAAAYLVTCSSCLHDSHAGEHLGATTNCWVEANSASQLLSFASCPVIRATVLFQPDNPTVGFRHDAWPGFSVSHGEV